MMVVIIMMVMMYCIAMKTIAVVTGPPSHHVPSAVDVTRQVSSIFSSHSTSGATQPHTLPVRLTPAHNAVLLGTYGIAPAHSGPSGLPVTLHPVLQAVDTRQVADRFAVFVVSLSCLHDLNRS